MLYPSKSKTQWNLNEIPEMNLYTYVVNLMALTFKLFCIFGQAEGTIEVLRAYSWLCS